MQDLTPYINKLEKFHTLKPEQRREQWEEMKPLLLRRLHELKVEFQFNSLWEKIKNNGPD
jgi:hypothetical protein